MNVSGIRRIIRRSLISIFMLSLIGGVGGFYVLLRNQAMEEAQHRAQILLSSALAVRNYTTTRVLPAFRNLPPDRFHEETVPSFAAQTVFRSVSAGASAYTYREPALNPTNISDRASPFEVELIRRFRDDPKLTEVTGVRADGAERLFYLARPITIKSEACLLCHDTPDRAPPAMLVKYGSSNGFGWRMGETVGIQLLTVPVTEQFRSTLELVGLLAAGLLTIFAIAYLALTISLEAMVVGPLNRLTKAADAASRASDARVPLPKSGAQEVRVLAEAIERLRLSLGKALSQLEQARKGPEQ
jgi:protein-histidine pros-kinase